MRNLERVFKALADRNRIRILKMLEAKPMCVCEVQEILGIGQSCVSRHLGILRNAGLVDNEKDGLWVNYSLAGRAEGVVAAIMAGLRNWGNGDPQVAEDRRRARSVRREEICA